MQPFTVFAAEVWGRLLAMLVLPVYSIFPPEDPDSEIWLIGENQGECLEDNGFSFYRYCRTRHSSKSVYFLIKTTSPLYREISSADENVVKYGSLNHVLMFSRAKLLFYTHTCRDVMYRRFFEMFGRGKSLVFLHHGTLGFKKFDPFYQRNRNIMDLFTVGSALEQDILVNRAGVDESRVLLTGYARSDFLAQDTSGPERQVLFMPTHRRHLDKRGQSDFIGQVKGLLGDDKVIGLLEEYDFKLAVYLHAHTQNTVMLSGIEHPRIRVVSFGEESVRDLLRSSMLMITDYSSVCWDFLALHKPVVFFRFDLDSYIEMRDSYIDLRDESYGEIAYTVEQLRELLSHYLENGCRIQATVSDAIGAASLEGDYASCKRIFAAAEKLLADGSC